MTIRLSRREFLAGAAVAGVAAGWGLAGTARAEEARAIPVVVSTWRHGVAANAAAWSVLEKGGSALDAVEAGVRVSEADPEVASVGYGGRPNAEGEVELDAAIMDGTTRNAGSVAGLRRIRHPISVARLVMEKTRHVMLVGDGARRFALARGFEEEDLLTAKSKAAWEDWKRRATGEAEGKDTIGMVAVDAKGGIAAACTTSGLAWKMPGRVGDSPLIGAGLYADDAGAASATGVGEEVIKTCGSFLVVEEMRRGASPADACRTSVERILRGHPENRKIQVAFVAVDPRGRVGAASIRPGFSYALRTGDADRLIEGEASVR